MAVLSGGGAIGPSRLSPPWIGAEPVKQWIRETDGQIREASWASAANERASAKAAGDRAFGISRENTVLVSASVQPRSSVAGGNDDLGRWMQRDLKSNSELANTTDKFRWDLKAEGVELTVVHAAIACRDVKEAIRQSIPML